MRLGVLLRHSLEKALRILHEKELFCDTLRATALVPELHAANDFSGVPPTLLRYRRYTHTSSRKQGPIRTPQLA